MSGFRHLKTCLTFPCYCTGDRGVTEEELIQISGSKAVLPCLVRFFCSSVDSKVIQ